MGEFSLKLFSTRIIVYFVPFCFRLLCFIEVCFYVWLFGFCGWGAPFSLSLPPPRPHSISTRFHWLGAATNSAGAFQSSAFAKSMRKKERASRVQYTRSACTYTCIIHIRDRKLWSNYKYGMTQWNGWNEMKIVYNSALSLALWYTAHTDIRSAQGAN